MKIFKNDDAFPPQGENLVEEFKKHPSYVAPFIATFIGACGIGGGVGWYLLYNNFWLNLIIVAPSILFGLMWFLVGAYALVTMRFTEIPGTNKFDYWFIANIRFILLSFLFLCVLAGIVFFVIFSVFLT